MAQGGFLARLPERDRNALKALVFAGVGIVLFVVADNTVFTAWRDANKKVENGQAKIAAIQKNVNDAVDAKQTKDKLRTQATLHDTSATLNRQSAQLLSLVGTLPAYRRLDVARLEPLPLRDEERYYRSAVSLQFAGTMGDLQQFLVEVGRAKPALKVERLNVTSDSKSPERVAGQVVLAGYAVVVKQERQSGRTTRRAG